MPNSSVPPVACSLYELPEDILLTIFKHAGSRALASSYSVSKSWRQGLRSSRTSFWVGNARGRRDDAHTRVDEQAHRIIDGLGGLADHICFHEVVDVTHHNSEVHEQPLLRRLMEITPSKPPTMQRLRHLEVKSQGKRKKKKERKRELPLLSN